MESVEHKKKLLLQIVILLSKALDLDEGIKLDHGQRVGLLAREMATQLRLVHPCLLYMAGLLHDIGGIGLEDHILHHALHSFQDMEARDHSAQGYTILSSFRPFTKLAIWVRDHHERYDGSGFPAAKSKQEISVEAGILHLADLLDVFTRTHPDLNQDLVRKFIRWQSGKTVSPAVASAGDLLFSRGADQIRLLTQDTNQLLSPQDFSWELPGLPDLRLSELLCQLLWLIARVADKKHQGREDHSIKVAFYGYQIAQALNSPDHAPIEVLQAALLHNIGLTAVPRDELLVDFDVRPEISSSYRQHPQIAAELINAIPELSHLAPSVAAHHEHYDGSGFPLGLKKQQIPQASQILSIANTYHWLAGGSAHNLEKHNQALRFIVKGKGSLFDPVVVEKAVSVLAVYGVRDINWVHDLPNVYAFFNTPRFDEGLGDQEITGPEREPVAEKSASVPSRQWQVAELSPALEIEAGHGELADLTGVNGLQHLSQALSEEDLLCLAQGLQDLSVGQTLSLTLRSQKGVDLECLATRRPENFLLLVRRVNTEPVFQQTQTLFYQNFLATPEAEILLDHGGGIQAVNSACCTCLQIPEKHLRQISIIQLFVPFLQPEQLQALQQFFLTQDQEQWSDEFAFVTGRGQAIALQTTILRILSQKREHETCLCRITDISARKQGEQEFIRRDSEFRTIVLKTTGMTGKKFFESLLHQFVTLTKASIGMISELADDLRTAIPLAFWEKQRFWPPPDGFLVKRSPCQLVIERGETYFPRRLHEFFPTNFLLKDRNISSYWGMPLRRHDGIVLGFLTVYSDAPLCHSREIQILAKIFQSKIANELERLQEERALLEKDRQLEANNQSLSRMSQIKSDMIAITSHDLKAPLAAIIGYSSLIDEHFASLDERKIKRYIHKIQEEGEKQLVFINNMLDLYRIESGVFELNLELYRIDILLANAMSSLREYARGRDIHFTFSMVGKAVPLDVDRQRMGQVINNLLANAIKYSPEKGLIAVHYQQDEQAVTFHIADQGPGIDEEEIHHIFDRYYMGRTDFKVRPQGAGLGLYIVQNIVKLHGGRVSACNRRSGGSRFTVTLPVTRENCFVQERIHNDSTS